MGLSTALSGGIVMIVLVYVLLMVPGVLDEFVLVQDAATEITDVENSISDTDISISGLTSSSGSDLITLTVTNDGTQRLWNFEKFNLIITYDGASSGRLIEELSYAGDCSGTPSSGNWCVDSISSDILDPGVLNENEDLNLSSTVSENLATGIVIILISTDNGVSSTISEAI